MLLFFSPQGKKKKRGYREGKERKSFRIRDRKEEKEEQDKEEKESASGRNSHRNSFYGLGVAPRREREMSRKEGKRGKARRHLSSLFCPLVGCRKGKRKRRRGDVTAAYGKKGKRKLDHAAFLFFILGT